MKHIVRSGAVGVLAALALGLVQAEGSAAGASAAPRSTLPDAVVVMGDGWASGEAGRWQGNTEHLYTSQANVDQYGTDLATFSVWDDYLNRPRWYRDLNRVYEAGSVTTGCQRGVRSPLARMDLPANTVRINLACSGAQSNHLWLSNAGGVTFKGELSQAARLSELAEYYDIKQVYITTGLEDAGFSDIVEDCAYAWEETEETLTPSYGYDCETPLRADEEGRLRTVRQNVIKTIDQVRGVLSQKGYQRSDYRLALTTYASPYPDGPDFTGPQDGRGVGNCPIRNDDASYLDNEFFPKLNYRIAQAGVFRGVEVIDLSVLFDGREACATSWRTTEEFRFTDWAHSQNPFDPYWGSGAVQGRKSESLHPNARGQERIAACLTVVSQSAPANRQCRRDNPPQSWGPQRYGEQDPVTLPDKGVLRRSVDVTQTYSPLDEVLVTAHITHRSPSTLSAYLVAPNGARHPVPHTVDPAGDVLVRGFVEVQAASQGRYRLEIEDTKTGDVGTLNSWTLHVF